MTLLLRSFISKFIFAFLIIGGFISICTSLSAAPAITIIDNFQEMKIGIYSDIFLDAKGQMTIDGIRGLDESQWIRSQEETPNFGYRQGALWLRLEIENIQTSKVPVILEIGYALHDYVDVYIFSGKDVVKMIAGDYRPHQQWTRDSRLPSFEIAAKNKQLVYIKILGSASKQVPLTLRSMPKQNETTVQWKVFQALYFGSLLAIAAYNLLVGLGTGLTVYFSYVGFLLGFCLYQLAISGLGFTIMWGDMPGLVDLSIFTGIGSTTILGNLFSIQLLGLDKKRGKKLIRRILYYMITSQLIVTPLLYFTVGYRGTMLFQLFLIVAPNCSCMIIYGLIALKRKEPVAHWYLFAWLIFLVGAIIAVLKTAGLMPTNNLTTNAQQIGSVVEFILLSFALAQRIKHLQKRIQTEQANALQAEKLAHEADARALAEERRLSEQRNQLMANTSHELRTPLNGIIGFLDLIGRGRYGNISDKANQQINKTLQLAESLKLQVNTILDLSKSKRGELTAKYQCFSLTELKSDVDNLAEGLKIKHKDLSYDSTMSGDDYQFVGDREKIFSILRNLIGNAFKFKDPKRPNQVRLSLNKTDEQLMIQVDDTGIGIPEKYKEQIFEEFGQVQGDARRSYEGTGLGLAMVKELAAVMSASIECISTPDKGSTFKVCIPATASQEVNENRIEFSSSKINDLDHEPIEPEHDFAHDGKISDISAELKRTPEDTPIISGQDWDVFILDDNETNCEVIRAILEIDGYDLRNSTSGSKALEMMQEKKPDLLLLDMMMPELSGEDVINKMRADSLLQEVPIILITARASEEDRLFGLTLGADDYLPKPIVAEELRLRVRNTVVKHRLLRQAERSTAQEKVIQLGELFNDLSHELKNILQATAGLRGLNAEDSLRSLAPIDFEEETNQLLVNSLIAESNTGDLLNRLKALPRPNKDELYKTKMRISQSLVSLDLTVPQLEQIWAEIEKRPLAELQYLESQFKIFVQYKILQDNAVQCGELTKSVLSYTRVNHAQSHTNLGDCFKQVQKLIQAKQRKVHGEWNVELGNNSAKIVEGKLIQVFLNLAINSLDAISELPDEERWVQVACSISASANSIDIYWSNGGPPIPDEIHQKLFDRGFSTKGEKGSGIGLYVSQRLTKEANGDLIYLTDKNNPCFKITLPLHNQQSQEHDQNKEKNNGQAAS